MKDKELLDILFEAYDAAVYYGSEFGDTWFPDSSRVDKAWTKLLKKLNVQNDIKIEDGTLYNINLANEGNLTHTES